MRLGSMRWLSAVATAPGSVRHADPSLMLFSARMFKDLLGAIWRRIPKPVRRWSMRLTNTRFTVTAAGLVFNDRGEILLLKHLFRPGSGWGLPGGFIEAGEQPREALLRELREETGLELEQIEIFETRAFKRPKQIEIVFRCYAAGEARPQSMEVDRAVWFPPSSLPEGLPADQQELIKRAVTNGAKGRD
jgi:8-oxo-dGTP diphosphatase